MIVIAIDRLWKVLERLLCDWQSTPYRWATERDVQSALAARLFDVLDRAKVPPILAHNRVDDWGGFEEGQPWGRVACEPVLWLNKEKATCRPDVVVWDDPAPGPEPHVREWPQFLACELKYRRSSSYQADAAKQIGRAHV